MKELDIGSWERFCYVLLSLWFRKSSDLIYLQGLTEHGSHLSIGIKKMGELDFKLFQKALNGKFSRKEVDVKAAELCSLWQDHFRDANWHPFKVVKVEGSEEFKVSKNLNRKARAAFSHNLVLTETKCVLFQEIIDKDDEKLKGLMDEFGEQVYQIVVTSLKEMNEYNPSGRYPVPELWNFKKNRKASLKEAIEYILRLWSLWKQKQRKLKRKRTN